MPRKPKKDRTSLIISVAIHAVLIGGVVFWAYKTGKLEQMRQAVLQYVKGEKKEEKKPEPVQQKQVAAPKLPPINQGVPQTQSSGTRRAVASDAPEAAGGGTFFQDTRKQVDTPSAGVSSQRTTNVPMLRVAPPPPPRPTFAPPARTTVKQLLAERAKAAASIESFGSEQIGKSSVKDAGEIVSRVSGATVVEGKYAVIRGLTDRYSAATLNGAELPSADPYRRSAALNMFPAKIIDRVTVTKTFTPDQPGSYTGGNINIVTKSFPERPFASFELGGSYNTQATGNKNFLTTSGGSTDWLGMDDGTRELASEFWDFSTEVPQWRTQLGQRISLTSTSPTVKKNLADAAAIERLTELAGPAEFAPAQKAPPPAHNFVMSFGDTAYFLNRPIGVFFSLPYSHSYGFYDNGKVARVSYNTIITDPELVEVEKQFDEVKGTEEVNWAGTASLSYQVHPNHQLGYNFIFNQFAETAASIRRGEDPDNNFFDLELNRLIYTERNLTSHQFRGDHLVDHPSGLKFNWLATFSDTSQDQQQRQYYANNHQFNLSGLDPKLPRRYWQELRENNQNLRFDFTQPFHPRDALTGEFKFGFFDNFSERNYRERVLQYNSPGIYSGDPNGFLTQDRLGALNPPTTNGNFVTYTWANYLQPPSDRSFYLGENSVSALYAMADVPVTERLRLIGGVRFERSENDLTAFTSTISEGVTPGSTNASSLRREDLLPAVGLVWNVKSNMNFRLNYGETIARPSFRELAPVRTFDLEYDAYVVGNPLLIYSEVKNYDARWEWFPRPGEIFSVGLFYKELTGVIEKEFLSSTGDIITFKNRPTGKVYGVELETRKSLDFLSPLLRDWNFGGNLSLIESEQPIPELDRDNHTRPDLLEPTRPLADQSPYILNLDLTYDNPRWGTMLSFNYNIFGPRLLITSLNSPDVFEQPSAQFDVTLTQWIGRNLRVKFAARNLLDPEINRTYGKNEAAVYSSYTRGRTFSLSLAYDF